jgi:hypothetical protein
VLQQSSSLFWDSTNNRLGIGTSSPANAIDSNGGFRLRGAIDFTGVPTSGVGLELYYNTSTNTAYNFSYNRNTSQYQKIGIEGSFTMLNGLSNGNVGIGTTTDAGFRLDVNGTARVTGSLSVDTLGTTNAATIGGTLQLISSIAVINKTQTAWISLATRNTSGSEVVYDLSNVGNIIAAGNVGIGTTSPSAKFEVNDSIAWTRSNGGNLLLGYGAESTPRLTLTRDIVGPAGAIAFSQGNSIATTGSAISQNASGNLVFLTSNGTALTERIRIPNTGNVLINTTTDAGYKLDVNGTARFVAPNTYAITYDTNGNFNAAGAYSNFSLTNAAGSLRAKLNNDGPNGTLTLYQNATGYIFLNGAQSGNNSFISTALSIGNQSAANASSILELTSTTKGFLPPRMTTTQKNAIASPAAGLVVYDTTLNKLCVFTTAWETVTSL